MLKIVDIITGSCAVVLVVHLGPNLPNAVGGSLWLFVLMTLFYFISYVLGIFRHETTLVNIILLLIIGTNYVDYLQLHGTYSKGTAAIFICIVAVLIFLCVYLAILKPWTCSFEEIRSDRALAVLRQNLKAIVLTYELFAVPYIVFICLIFISFHSYFATASRLLRMIPVAFICVPCALALMNFALVKVKDVHLERVFKNEKIKIRSNSILKKTLFAMMGSYLFFGTMIELARNQWLLWVGSFVTTISVVSLILQTYRSKLLPSKQALHESVDDVRLSSTPQYWIKLGIVNFTGLLLVSIGIMGLLYVLR